MQLLPILTLMADVPQAQGPDLTRYFAVLGGVALVLLLLAFGLKRLVSNSTLGLRKGRKGMQVVEVLSLGSRRQVAVIRCYDRTFALGLGEKSVAVIAELDAEVVQADAPAQQNLVGEPNLVPRPQSANAAPQLAQTQAAPASSLQGQDPFEALLDQAQAQLEARRQREASKRATVPNPSEHTPGGLQELC